MGIVIDPITLSLPPRAYRMFFDRKLAARDIQDEGPLTSVHFAALSSECSKLSP